MEIPQTDSRLRDLDLQGRSLRQHTARGVVINALFMVGLAFLSMAKGLVAAGFLERSDYGVWGLLAVTAGTLLWLRDVGIGDKFIQQDEEDQELAYQKAFTLELMLALVSIVIVAAALPLFALAYGEWKIVAPGLVALLVLPAGAFATPLWIYYRQMRFVRQRLIQAVDPVVGFVVTVALAIAGAGYWSFIIGMVAGGWAMALVALISRPVPMKLRFERGTLADYVSFSWPLFAASGGALVIAQSSAFATQWHLGLAAVGAVALAANVAQFANRVQVLIEQALYPAICAVKDRTDLLRESFLKSNRLGMMWGVPFGVGLALFFGDLVHFGIGDKWEPALTILQVTGLVVAMSQFCFNWDGYFRARAETKPMAISAWITAVSFLAAGIPLLILFDLRGLAIGIGVQAAVHLACRVYFLTRLFEGLHLARHALAGILPVLPGVAVVLGLRLLESGERSGVEALAEVAIFVVLTTMATWIREAPLLREMVGYLSARKPADAIA